MIEWNYIIVGLSVLLFLFLLWKEVKRENKARLLWRLLATIFAVISLACMALPITYNHSETVATSHEAVLLTEGFNPDSLNKFLSENGNNIPVFAAEKNLKDARKYNAVYVTDVSLLSRDRKDINSYHVFGYGFEKDELNSIKNASVIFHPTEVSSGITAINWNRKIKIGGKLFVQGSVNNSTSGKAKIVLKSFNTTLDSINVSLGKNQRFELTTVPRHADRNVFTIAVLEGRDTIEKELIPVQVEQGEPLKVFMLSSSPDFESKFLKGYLSQKGYTVVARTAISKNKFVKDFLNSPTVSLDRITSSFLDKFDITIADAAALTTISRAELATIQTQAAQKDMGLIIRADSAASSSSFYTNLFPLAAASLGNLQQFNLYLADSSNKMPTINIENPLFIRNQQGTQPVVLDKQNKIFVNSTLYGSGKIILTTLTNTFSWALEGNQNDYGKFWSELLNRVTAEQVADEAWAISPALPEINKAVQVQVQTNIPGVPQAQIGESSVFLKANDDLQYRWLGTYYPTKEGWQTGIQLNGKPFYFYAYNKNDWKNVKASERIEATEQFISENINTKNKGGKKIEMIESEVPKIVFFLLFLLFVGFLWFENKL